MPDNIKCYEEKAAKENRVGREAGRLLWQRWRCLFNSMSKEGLSDKETKKYLSFINSICSPSASQLSRFPSLEIHWHGGHPSDPRGPGRKQGGSEHHRRGCSDTMRF